MLAGYTGRVPHPILSAGYFDMELGKIISAESPHFKPPDGSTVYHFNSLGYRSEEFDPHAPIKIFVCGCSYAFGMGVPYDQTWPVHLARLIAAKSRLSDGDVAVQNFSQIGASNDYIARTIVQQCERARPDLVVVAFTHLNRTEYLAAPATIRNLGSWSIAQPDTGHTTPGKNYFRHYNDHYGLLKTLKNMHWVQSAMQARRIPFLFAWIDVEIFREASMWKHPEISFMRSLIDMSRFCRHSIRDEGIFVDVVDGHPGPSSQRNFAAKLFEAVQGVGTMSGAQGVPSSKQRRFSEVSHLVATLKAPFLGLTGRNRESRALIVTPSFSDGGEYLRNIADKRANGARVISCVSDDSIVRRLVAACEAERPNFVCAWFSGEAVYEHVAEAGVIELADDDSGNEGTSEWASFFPYLTSELRTVNLLKNALLAQEYLSAKKIPYRLIVPPLNRQNVHPVARIFVELLNLKAIMEAAERGTLTKPGTSKPRSRHSNKSTNRDANMYPLW